MHRKTYHKPTKVPSLSQQKLDDINLRINGWVSAYNESFSVYKQIYQFFTVQPKENRDNKDIENIDVAILSIAMAVKSIDELNEELSRIQRVCKPFTSLGIKAKILHMRMLEYKYQYHSFDETFPDKEKIKQSFLAVAEQALDEFTDLQKYHPLKINVDLHLLRELHFASEVRSIYVSEDKLDNIIYQNKLDTFASYVYEAAQKSGEKDIVSIQLMYPHLLNVIMNEKSSPAKTQYRKNQGKKKTESTAAMTQSFITQCKEIIKLSKNPVDEIIVNRMLLMLNWNNSRRSLRYKEICKLEDMPRKLKNLSPIKFESYLAYAREEISNYIIPSFKIIESHFERIENHLPSLPELGLALAYFSQFVKEHFILISEWINTHDSLSDKERIRLKTELKFSVSTVDDLIFFIESFIHISPWADKLIQEEGVELYELGDFLPLFAKLKSIKKNNAASLSSANTIAAALELESTSSVKITRRLNPKTVVVTEIKKHVKQIVENESENEDLLLREVSNSKNAYHLEIQRMEKIELDIQRIYKGAKSSINDNQDMMSWRKKRIIPLSDTDCENLRTYRENLIYSLDRLRFYLTNYESIYETMRGALTFIQIDSFHFEKDIIADMIDHIDSCLIEIKELNEEMLKNLEEGYRNKCYLEGLECVEKDKKLKDEVESITDKDKKYEKIRSAGEKQIKLRSAQNQLRFHQPSLHKQERLLFEENVRCLNEEIRKNAEYKSKSISLKI